jgi:hypothetical protein
MLEYNAFSDLLVSSPKRISRRRREKMQEKQGFNIDSLVEELDKEFASEAESEDSPVAQVEEEPAETEEAEQEVEEELEDEEAEEDEEVEEEAEEEDEELHRRNEAFKRLREERDQYAETDKFLEEIAAEYGLTKQQLINNWKDETAKRRAKKEGITPQQFARQQELEQKVAELELQNRKEIFNIRTQALVDKYNLSEGDVDDMFAQANTMGIDITTNPDLLEFVYKATNYDSALERGRQQQLANSKKRSKTAAGRTGTRGTPTEESDNWDNEIESILREQRLIK